MKPLIPNWILSTLDHRHVIVIVLVIIIVIVVVVVIVIVIIVFVVVSCYKKSKKVEGITIHDMAE